MKRHFTKPQGRQGFAVSGTASQGFTIYELCVVIAVVLVMTTMAIPVIQSTLAFYDLQAAVSAVSGSIQSTRYRAISDGYPYKVTFTKSDNKFQIASCPGWLPTNPTNCPFSNVGNPVTFVSGGSKVALGSDVAIQFFPSGSVSFISGSSPINLSRIIGKSQTKTKSITVTNYGSVKVQ